MAVPWTMSSLHRPFVVDPGYSLIPEKLVTKIRTGEFIDLADLLAENLKGQETEPQTYLDGKLLVTSSKKRIQEITDIVTWVEAFTVYSWILCSAHPSRWQDMTQYKLLILKTSRQFPGKAWLHYDIAFRKDAAASGLVDWSRMNLDLYNFHTRATLLQTGLSSDVPSSASRMLASSTIICQSAVDPLVSTVPFGPHSPIASTRGQLPCHRVNASDVRVVARSSQPTLWKNFVHNADIHGSVQISNVVFPVPVNVVTLTQDVCDKLPVTSAQSSCPNLSSIIDCLQRDLVSPSRVTPINAEKLQRELYFHPDQTQVGMWFWVSEMVFISVLTLGQCH